MSVGTVDDDIVPCDPIGDRRCDSRIVSVKWTTGYGGADGRALHRKYATGPKPKSTMLKICTWNVRGLNMTGKLSTVEAALANIAITGLAETHWKVNGHFISPNGNLIICSSNENISRNGVGIIINKTIKDSLLGYRTINDRIVAARFKATPINLNIIQVYAPTSSSSQEEIDSFYGKLGSAISDVPNRELLLVLGDFNAKIGITSEDDHLRSVVGKHGIGSRNERGEMLLEFCAENNLFVANSNFKHHIRRMYTWQSPDGHSRNQIDYILIKSRWRTSVRDAKTYPGMDCGSDHNALVAEVCLRLKRPTRNAGSPNKWYLGRNETYKTKVVEAVHGIATQDMEPLSAEELWKKFKRALEAPTENIKPNANPRKPWISDETWNLIRDRQETKSQGISHGNNLDRYNELTRGINRALRRDKDDFITSICKEIEQHANKNEPRDLFKRVRFLSRSFQPRHLPVKDDSGHTLTDKADIIERWRLYCENLMAPEEDPHPTNTMEEREFTEPIILRSEVESATRKLSYHKAAGSDGVVAEMLRAAGETGIDVMQHICNKIWISGEWPDDWTEAIYVPLHKKGDREVCGNYRTISLINHASKIMLHVIQERLKPYLLPQISQEQAGFIPGKGTRDQLINVRQMIEKFYEFNVPVIFCFLDYTKAFDTVRWSLLWQVLEEMGVPKHLIFLISSLYTQNKAYVRVEDQLSRQFNVGKGVRQGCVLSPLLFNIYGEWIIRKATENWNGGVSIGGRKISNLRYADDTTILANTEEEMELFLRRVEHFSGEAGLKLNRSKCCLMVIDRAEVLPRRFDLIPDIERKEKTIYLGACISNKGGSEEEIKRRIGMAKSALTKLVKIWKDHNIRKKTKKRLVQTLIFPIATYGSESWTLNAACRRRIEAFEMVCYRRMLRIPWTDHRTNVSILEELQITDNERLLPTIQRRILKFFGHVIRRDSIEKLIIQGKVEGRRKRGRSPVRFMDQIKTLTNLSVAEVMRTADDREAWRRLTMQ